MKLGTVQSIQVGCSREYHDVSFPSKVWQSAIAKHATHGPVRVTKTNVDGDEQSDRVHHGGVDKAVLAYAVSHYAYWRTELPTIPWSNGSFGENLSMDGLDESACCIGDVMKIGSCVLQISQPRQPCWKLSKFWNEPRLAVQVQKTRKTGWYYRVVQEGEISAGQSIELVDRSHPKLTVQWASDVMYAQPRDAEHDFVLVSCPLLSVSWQTSLRARAEKGVAKNDAPRLHGH